MSARKNLKIATPSTVLGELRAKRSQDNKPSRVLREACPDRLSRPRLLEPLVASQSLGDGIIPSSAVAFEADPATLIPARPFGLGLRFDEAHPVAPEPLLTHSRAARIKPSRESSPSLAQSAVLFKDARMTALKSLARFYLFYAAGFFSGCAFAGFLVGIGNLG